jgi:hypothetical protein
MRSPGWRQGTRQGGVKEIDRDGVIQRAAHAGRRYCPPVGTTIPIEPSRDFRMPLTKPARGNANPDPNRETPFCCRDDLARVARRSNVPYMF